MPEEKHPEVERAHKKLEAAMDEACDTDVNEADTAELIRMEESLAVASEAAREAIAVRQRHHPDSAARRENRGENHRYFDDASGRRWHAFAVYPTAGTAARALPAPYQNGWVSFDSGPETRRIAPIPNGWQTLSEDELRRMVDKAVVATRRVQRPRDANRPDAERRAGDAPEPPHPYPGR